MENEITVAGKSWGEVKLRHPSIVSDGDPLLRPYIFPRDSRVQVTMFYEMFSLLPQVSQAQAALPRPSPIPAVPPVVTSPLLALLPPANPTFLLVILFLPSLRDLPRQPSLPLPRKSLPLCRRIIWGTPTRSRPREGLWRQKA